MRSNRQAPCNRTFVQSLFYLHCTPFQSYIDPITSQIAYPILSITYPNAYSISSHVFQQTCFKSNLQLGCISYCTSVKSHIQNRVTNRTSNHISLNSHISDQIANPYSISHLFNHSSNRIARLFNRIHFKTHDTMIAYCVTNRCADGGCRFCTQCMGARREMR